METTILGFLNDEQRAPAETCEGPVLVTAGAGSGKTRLLTHRIAHIVTELNVSPYNILAITFTNKAAREMKERLEQLIPNSDDMWICTFHAMCSKILRHHANKIGLDSNFSIYGDTEKNRLIKRILQQDPEFLALEKNKLKVETVAFHISNAKNELQSPDDYMDQLKHDKNAKIIINAYRNYQRELLVSNAVDFDDMLVKVYELFKERPDVLEYYQTKFRYIHVDEFQDTNVVQYELVKLLGSQHKNIFVVGDEDQCIYSWRGAKFSNVQKFIDENKDSIHIYKLEQNYRSTKNILKVANSIIKNNSNRLDKNLWTDNLAGDEVKFITAYNDLEEAEMVATKIKSLVQNDGYKYSDFAVLMRINALSRVIEEKFINYQIPYEVYGGFKFFERKEVKDVLSYLKIISNPKDNDSFTRLLTFPKKGIGEATIEKLLNASKEYNISAYEIARSGLGLDGATIKKLQPTLDLISVVMQEKQLLPISKLVAKVIELFDIKNAFSKAIEEDISKLMNIETLEKSILEYEEANKEVTLEDYLQSITLTRDIDSLDSKDNHVAIMTIHSAKGLEFNVVFVVGLVDGILPLSRSLYSSDPNELEEERRLMYVATTRAMKHLYLTRPTCRFNFETKQTEQTNISRFVKEAGLGLEPNNYTMGTRATNVYDNSYRRGPSMLDDFSVSEDREPKQPISNDKIAFYKQFKVGTKVFHKSFGNGTVIVEATDMNSAFVTIKFDVAGVKTLSLKFAPLTIIGD